MVERIVLLSKSGMEIPVQADTVKQIAKPKNCFGCNKPLFNVIETESTLYNWNSRKKKYEPSQAKDGFERFITHSSADCQEEVTDLFDTKVENYRGGE
jgi:hypothetical protein